MGSEEDRIAELFGRIGEKYEIAERRLKNYEDTTGQGLVVASLNELRYVGNHLLIAINNCENDTDKKIEQLQKAERHCQRATYDVCASAMSEYFLKLERFRSFYVGKHYKHVIAAMPDYDSYLDHFRSAQKIVEDVKLNDEKELYYETLDELLVPIKEWVDKLYEVYIPRIDQLVTQEEERERIEGSRHKNMMNVTIIAVVVAVISVLIAFFK